MSDFSLDTNSEQFLKRSVRRGTAILFTGAGFSTGAHNRRGDPIPVGSALKEQLWPLAFPGVPFDTNSSLGNVFDVAVTTQGNATRALLRESLTIDPAAIPDTYRIYFSLPWWRIYTLNFDDLPEATVRRYHLTAELTSLSALRDAAPLPDAQIVVYLNGTLDDYPNVTFSPYQYGERALLPSPFYHTLGRDLMSHSAIFIGTQLDEPPLWQSIALRGARPPGRELRPRSFLVTPFLSIDKAAMLERFNVVHVAMTTEQFADVYLRELADENLPRPRLVASTSDPFEPLDLALGEPKSNPEEFLIGREPAWSDITEGYAIERSFEAELGAHASHPGCRAVLISGTAGSGKSTTLRRLALFMQAEGRRVSWLRSDSYQSTAVLRSIALSLETDVIVIDAAERFGERGVQMIREICETENGPQVMVAYAGGPCDEMSVPRHLEPFNSQHLVIPTLSDSDIVLLVEALRKANRLGILAGKSREAQEEAIRSRSARQLLVAMLEATSGVRFEDKIVQECETLASDLTTAYAVLALATTNRYQLSVDDVLSALSDVSASGLDIVSRLERQHLIVRFGDGTLAARHPVVAREVVSTYRRAGQLGEALARLIFVMASKLVPDGKMTKERRLLVSLLNHQYVGQIIDSPSQARQAYADVEYLLANEFHYWLQRGSYELERGDISLAHNFLGQARSLAAGDYMVDTEWAYLLLERACRDPRAISAPEWVAEGLEALIDIISRFGERTPNTYVVLADKTIHWCEVGPLSWGDRRRLLESARAKLREGSRYHAGNSVYAQATGKVDRAYLELANQLPSVNPSTM